MSAYSMTGEEVAELLLNLLEKEDEETRKILLQKLDMGRINDVFLHFQLKVLRQLGKI